jgi:type II secretory pathway pseudopilin PulG
MKRLIALIGIAAALAAVVASSAPASAPANKRVAALELQVKALRAQVKALKAQFAVIRQTVDSNHDELRNEIARNKVSDACLALGAADLFQSTWANVDQRLATGPAFGPQEPLGDVACKPIGVTRPGILANPTIGVFWSLTGSLIG